LLDTAAAVGLLGLMLVAVGAMGAMVHGGYDLANVARAWTAAWAVMNGVELGPELPPSFGEDMRRFGFRSSSLWDPPIELSAETRRRAQEFAGRQVEGIRRSIFPIHSLVLQ